MRTCMRTSVRASVRACVCALSHTRAHVWVTLRTRCTLIGSFDPVTNRLRDITLMASYLSIELETADRESILSRSTLDAIWKIVALAPSLETIYTDDIYFP